MNRPAIDRNEAEDAERSSTIERIIMLLEDLGGDLRPHQRQQVWAQHELTGTPLMTLAELHSLRQTLEEKLGSKASWIEANQAVCSAIHEADMARRQEDRKRFEGVAPAKVSMI